MLSIRKRLLLKLLREFTDELRVLLNTKRKVLYIHVDDDDNIVIESSKNSCDGYNSERK